MRPVIVLRSNDYCFLGCIRSLATQGIPVIPVVFDWPDSGPWFSNDSIYLTQPNHISNPYTDPDAAIAGLVSLGERCYQQYQERLLIIPSSDTNLMLLMDHYDQLKQYFLFNGSVDFTTIRTDVIAKDRCMQSLASEGILIPQSFSCRLPSDLPSILEQVRFPCIYKPITKDYGQSFYRSHGQLKAVECSNPDDLRKQLIHELDAGHELLVQEKIIFRGIQDEIPFYLYADKNHQIRLASTGVKEALYPTPYGTATALRLTWNKSLLPKAQAIVSALKWRGILMIEFMRDQRDEGWKVIEINARPWLFTDFFRQMGFNYLHYLYHDCYEELPQYHDLKVPDQQLLRSRPVHLDPLMQQKAYPQSPHRLTRWMEAFDGDVSYCYADPEDPKPFEGYLSELMHERPA